MYPKLTGKEIKKLNLLIKNNQDVSSLIKERDLRGVDLSRARIKDLTRIREDLSNACFEEAVIGEEKRITNLLGCNLTNCNFKRAKFLGTLWFRRVIAVNTNFNCAEVMNAHYQNSDFRGANFCGCLMRFNSLHFRGAKFDEDFVKEFCKMLNYEVELKKKWSRI